MMKPPYQPSMHTRTVSAGVRATLIEFASEAATNRSGAGAAGLWQFTPKGAGAYGLRIDRWVDERLDPERSTDAAAPASGLRDRETNRGYAACPRHGDAQTAALARAHALKRNGLSESESKQLIAAWDVPEADRLTLLPSVGSPLVRRPE